MWVESSRENEARFLHQNEVNLQARQGNKMAANLDLFRVHLHRQPNANTKLDLRPLKCANGFQREGIGVSLLDHAPQSSGPNPANFVAHDVPMMRSCDCDPY